MSMEKINGSPLLRQGLLDNARRQSEVAKDQKAPNQGSTSGVSGLAPASGDTAQISEAAHRLVDLRRAVDTGRLALASVSETREEKIAQARERIATGFYESGAVRDKVAVGVEEVLKSMTKL